MVIQTKETVSIIQKVYKAQMNNMPASFTRLSGRREKIMPNGWIRSVFFIGVMAIWQVTDDIKYLEAALNWSEDNDWLPGPHPRLADDHCAGQIYTELYMVYKDKKMVRPIQKTFDNMIADLKPGREEWYWCDALFMAPPVLARLAAATKDQRYLDCMNHLWWDTAELLYDREYDLFFRDRNFIIQPDGTGRREKNGQKIFWSRGNGWVLAGIVRVLQFIPDDYPARPQFIRLFQEMAAAVSRLQHADGLWRTSLLDPEHFPARETSGSALFCYAIAWGINNAILDRETYITVVENAWRGLIDCISPTGRLGWVQLPADGARSVKKNDSMEYGSGAFLLAGSEMMKLQC